VSYNASVVKIYNATSSLLRFENKNCYFFYENALATYYNAFVHSEVEGLSPKLQKRTIFLKKTTNNLFFPMSTIAL
jgi:hypothetical protein